MTELLALGSAAMFGAGDFLGGLASRAASSVKVTAVAQVASVALIPPLLFMIAAPDVTAADLAWGAAGGVFGMLGVLGLFTALARGPMAIVAPTTGVLGALVPVGFALVSGERPPAVTLVGIAVGLFAITAVSVSEGPGGRVSRDVLLAAVGAGLGFGLFFIMFGQTGEGSGMWPLVAARAASVPLALLLARMDRGSVPRGPVLRLACGAGLLDMAANGLFLAAAQRGLLAVAAVLAALYPAFTALMARVALHERLSRPQLSGVVAALVAVVLIGLPA